MNNIENNSENTTEKTTLEQYEDLIQEIGLTLTYKFVPFSISRNSEEKNKSLNWKVTLSSGKKSMTTDYMKGSGHLKYPNSFYLKNSYQKRMINEATDSACETGVARKLKLIDNDVKFSLGNMPLPNPTLQEVLYSLTQDADVRHYLTYDQWASDFGYDPDSRKGEKTYNDCRAIAVELIKVLGSEKRLEQLSELVRTLDEESVVTPSKPKM